MVSTNTFGANSLHFPENTLKEIVEAAVRIAREAAASAPSGRPRYVALDIGPTGKLLKPYGDLAFEDAVAVFAKTIRLEFVMNDKVIIAGGGAAGMFASIFVCFQCLWCRWKAHDRRKP